MIDEKNSYKILNNEMSMQVYEENGSLYIDTTAEVLLKCGFYFPPKVKSTIHVLDIKMVNDFHARLKF